MNKLKVMTILGTRPEIIRLSRVLPKMDLYFNHKIVYTKQSYDYELSEIFFRELQLRKPDYLLEVKADTLGGQIANIIRQTEEVMLKEKPDALLIEGDTNSALCTIIAKRLKIPIFHTEAGNRAFDWDIPEEVNRRIVDHISDFNLAYTERARRYLLQEGIDPNTVFVVGSPFGEIFSYFSKKIDASTIFSDLKLHPNKYFVVSIHREENVDKKESLKEIFQSLRMIAKEYNLPIVVSLHPRTKKRLEAIRFPSDSRIMLCRPFGYFAYNKLQKNAVCVLSDSGTVQEESAILEFPAVQVRKSTEKPEAFDTGSIILSGLDKDAVIEAVHMAVSEFKHYKSVVKPRDYIDTNFSEKVVKIIFGFVSIQKSAKNRTAKLF